MSSQQKTNFVARRATIRQAIEANMRNTVQLQHADRILGLRKSELIAQNQKIDSKLLAMLGQ